MPQPETVGQSTSCACGRRPACRALHARRPGSRGGAESCRGRASWARIRSAQWVSKPCRMVPPSALGRVEHLVGVEVVDEDLAGPGQHGQQPPPPSSRRRGTAAGSWGARRCSCEPSICGPLGEVATARVAVHRALGQAGRARRVDDERAGVGVDAGQARAASVASLTAPPPPAGRPSRRAGGHGRRPSTTRRRSFGQRASASASIARVVHRSGAVDGDEGGRVGLVDGVGDVVGPVAGVQRHGHAADLRGWRT